MKIYVHKNIPQYFNREQKLMWLEFLMLGRVEEASSLNSLYSSTKVINNISSKYFWKVDLVTLTELGRICTTAKKFSPDPKYYECWCGHPCTLKEINYVEMMIRKGKHLTKGHGEEL